MFRKIFLLGLVAAGTVANRLMNSCISCNSFLTFNWTTPPEEAKRIQGISPAGRDCTQYCFECKRFTLRDPQGEESVADTVRGQLALAHYQLHHAASSSTIDH
jgi:hypothetical protein